MQTDYLRGPFVDGLGVDIAHHLDHVEIVNGMWPRQCGIFDRKVFTKLARWYHDNYPFCFVCGRSPRVQRINIQCHHILGGACRSHEACNIAMLCCRHHDNANTSDLTKSFLLWRKWVVDPLNCDWARLAIIRGRPLSELEVDEERHKGFVQTMGDAWPWLSSQYQED